MSEMRGGIDIDWRRLVDGTLAYEMPWPAADGDRFERIARGFAAHYQLDWRSPDAFGFSRGEGYTRFGRRDAFNYVDRGRVERLHAEAQPLDSEGGNVVLLPPGYRGLRFTLNMRVILIFYAVLLATVYLAFFPATPVIAWIAGFLAIYVLHILLVIASLRRKLAGWVARESWH
ncbi:hypothetical protein [Sphingomonas cavernae]|uniref:Uncharacterized protein n=1 Tax=Sphingomonas cavernae TaxID=2320861 RepID=A0A418WLR4_9SPHN|nr:hypothetical protein [Sphingomonas cavernae]RJF90958.1 hypothetical protein D3876_12440 [Sphingomonas cavernae]